MHQDEVALSVPTTVIGHQRDKGWALVDAGWMAMSRDRGTQDQAVDYRYGQVFDLQGVPIPGCTVSGANQEHGIVSFSAAPDGAAGIDIAARLLVCTLLRILPNHACATAAQVGSYQLIDADGPGIEWPRFSGW